MASNSRSATMKLKLDEEQVKEEHKDATIGDYDVKTERDSSNAHNDVKDNPIQDLGYYDSSDEEEEEVDDERYILYMKTIRESKGFHIPEKPQGIRVRDCGASIIKDLMYMEKFARAALVWYMEHKSSEDKEKYELARVVRANGSASSGVMLYITFVGHAVGSNCDVQFRAIVLDGINETVKVYSCEIDPLGC